MPTIKTKRTMKAREFIVFGIKNNIKNLIVNAINEECGEKAIIHFDSNAMPIVSENVYPYHMFKIEIEEEITGDTVIPRILEIGVGSLSGYSAVKENVSVNRIINKKNNYIYIIDDDYAITPFYRDGKLVE